MIGKTVLRELEADDVIRGLQAIAETRSSRTARDTRAALVRVITCAQARNLVGRIVATLVGSPPGKAPRRPSRSLTVPQAQAVLAEAEKDPLYAYVVLSRLVGVRTEEARALRWDYLHLDGDPDADPRCHRMSTSGGLQGPSALLTAAGRITGAGTRAADEDVAGVGLPPASRS